MSSLKRFSVDRVAELARIELGADTRDKTSDELNRILDFIDVLEELNLDSVEPFYGATQLESQTNSPVRNDTVTPSIAREEVLSNAPDSDGECYQVPPVFD